MYPQLFFNNQLNIIKNNMLYFSNQCNVKLSKYKIYRIEANILPIFKFYKISKLPLIL
jgi:hypothetical protein